MLKTNNKKVVDRVYRDFLGMAQDFSCDDLLIGSCLWTIHDEIENAAAGYNFKSYFEAFNYFCSCFCFGEVYADNIRQYLADVLEETPEEANKFDFDKMLHTYRHLLYKAWLKACDAYGVNPCHEL